MRARWCGAGSVGSVDAALQVACLRRCRLDEGWRNRCSRWGRADRHSLNRRGGHGTVCMYGWLGWYRAAAVGVLAGGEATVDVEAGEAGGT